MEAEFSVIDMTSSSAACCVVHLNQQQERNIQHLKQLANHNHRCLQALPQKCTIVENGRVVVKQVVRQVVEQAEAATEQSDKPQG